MNDGESFWSDHEWLHAADTGLTMQLLEHGDNELLKSYRTTASPGNRIGPAHNIVELIQRLVQRLSVFRVRDSQTLTERLSVILIQ